MNVMNETVIKKEPFPTYKIILFSLGGGAVNLIAQVTGLMTYFYVPPETKQADFPAFLPSHTYFGLTFLGLILFTSNLLPMFLGPVIASWSDRSNFKLGRRRFFMVISFIPVAVLSFMLFTPPVQGVSIWNAVYLFVVMILLNVFRSFSGVSAAIQAEFGSTEKIIMYFSTFGSVGWILGYIVGSTLVYNIKDAFASSGMTSLQAFQTTAAILIGIGCLLTILQFAVIDEKRYGSGKSSPIGLKDAFKKVIKNKQYISFIFANQVYLWGDAIFNVGLIYFVTINYGLPDSMMIIFAAVQLILSLAQYPLVNIISGKIGKKKVFSFALAVMIVDMVLFAFPGIVPIPKMTLAWIIVATASIYSAVTGILPSAIQSEIIREDCVRTGVASEASYNAVGGFLLTIPAQLPNLIIPSILLLGKSQKNNSGVILVALLAGACMLAGMLLINLLYNEKKILASLREHGYK